ncbi:hypothetical protein [Effusibacillus lacus]|uniref:Hemerythrin-like domain-containing protein n=1 Tax=Effusibacillus lacus TaxID=1348429 RepID=A0A292YK21_9BACL|nr:hypothetical protein [Effusibacillus lacus]TCS68978.1 hypothetical protein EDD64_13950 [Effusibacillus lacus]GAX91457.1 hypothetical protein EFBL_3126 [Effusibacillus lacus]
MTRSLVERCREVIDFLNEKTAERLAHAEALLKARGKERLLHAIPFLQAELLMHQEVRTLWPYLLVIPESEEARYFCEKYNCKLDELGQVLQARIQEMNRFLDVIEKKLQKTYPPGSFWGAIRDELLAKICGEARKVLEG